MGGDLGSSDDDSDYHSDGNDDDHSENNGVGKEVVTYDSDDIEIEDVKTSDNVWQMANKEVGEFRKQETNLIEIDSTIVNTRL